MQRNHFRKRGLIMRRGIISVLALCVVLLFWYGQHIRNTGPLPADYTVGVIRTNGSENRSDILYFDKTLSHTGTTRYNYATMGNVFYAPVTYDGALYVVPQGPARAKDAKTILCQDLDTFEQTAFFLDQIAIYGLSIDSSAIFAANNINHQSFISRIDRTNKTVKTAVYNGLYISIVYSYRDKLYAFSSESTSSGAKSSLHCLDPVTLKELQRIDISEFGSDVYSVAGVGDTLYFAPLTTSQDTLNHIVCAYHISSKEIKAIAFPYNVSHILNRDNRLYITHGNLVTGEGTALSVFNRETGKINTYDLGMWPGQIAIHGDALYVMGTNSIAKYDLQTMKKEAEAEIPLAKGDYISGIFTK